MALQLTIIAVVLVIVSVAFASAERDALEKQTGMRSLAVAQAVAENGEIRELVTAGDISPRVQAIAESVRHRTEVSFVVVTDTSGVRHSHPNPQRIGHEVSTDPSEALSGVSDWSVQTGTLGRSVRGKVPIWGSTGRDVVGMVSVGILTTELSDALRSRLWGLMLAAGVAFGVGGVAAYLGARRIRRQTLGLEPPEIAAMYEHRDGMLRSLHEGVLAVDHDGIITLVNDGGRTMLGLEANSVGRRLDERPDLSPLLALPSGDTPEVDTPFDVGTRSLLVRASPITIRSKGHGAVYTFRDRTELRGLVSELESAQGLVDALRAQAHEHTNNLHTISGLIELGRHNDVLSIVRDHSISQRALTDLYSNQTSGASPIVAALLAKTATAAEHNICLRTHLGNLPQVPIDVARDLVTIIGNLVDNAVDHLSETSVAGGEVEVAVWDKDGTIRIEVSDSGNGMSSDVIANIFEPGFTTKDRRSHDGLGLALVKEFVEKYRGSIALDCEPGSGSLFRVSLQVGHNAEVDYV